MCDAAISILEFGITARPGIAENNGGYWEIEMGMLGLLGQLADRTKEDVLFIGVFQAFEIHGLAKDLESKPRPDQRLQVAEMSWK